MSAAPRRPPAGRTSSFNVASPPTDCWPCSDHFLQHQDPGWGAHAQTIPGDAGSHDGLPLERNAGAGVERIQRKPQTESYSSRVDVCFMEKDSFHFRINNEETITISFRPQEERKIM